LQGGEQRVIIGGDLDGKIAASRQTTVDRGTVRVDEQETQNGGFHVGVLDLAKLAGEGLLGVLSKVRQDLETLLAAVAQQDAEGLLAGLIVSRVDARTQNHERIGRGLRGRHGFKDLGQCRVGGGRGGDHTHGGCGVLGCPCQKGRLDLIKHTGKRFLIGLLPQEIKGFLGQRRGVLHEALKPRLSDSSVGMSAGRNQRANRVDPGGRGLPGGARQNRGVTADPREGELSRWSRWIVGERDNRLELILRFDGIGLARRCLLLLLRQFDQIEVDRFRGSLREFNRERLRLFGEPDQQAEPAVGRHFAAFIREGLAGAGAAGGAAGGNGAPRAARGAVGGSRGAGGERILPDQRRGAAFQFDLEPFIEGAGEVVRHFVLGGGRCRNGRLNRGYHGAAGSARGSRVASGRLLREQQTEHASHLADIRGHLNGSGDQRESDLGGAISHGCQQQQVAPTTLDLDALVRVLGQQDRPAQCVAEIQLGRRLQFHQQALGFGELGLYLQGLGHKGAGWGVDSALLEPAGELQTAGRVLRREFLGLYLRPTGEPEIVPWLGARLRLGVRQQLWVQCADPLDTEPGSRLFLSQQKLLGEGGQVGNRLGGLDLFALLGGYRLIRACGRLLRQAWSSDCQHSQDDCRYKTGGDGPSRSEHLPNLRSESGPAQAVGSRGPSLYSKARGWQRGSMHRRDV